MKDFLSVVSEKKVFKKKAKNTQNYQLFKIGVAPPFEQFW